MTETRRRQAHIPIGLHMGQNSGAGGRGSVHASPCPGLGQGGAAVSDAPAAVFAVRRVRQHSFCGQRGSAACPAEGVWG